MYHNIVLIGMMGSGKSTIGRQISQQYDIQFSDTDTLIEQEINEPIRTFFDKHGEAAFRKIETGCCKTLLTYKNHVIATGGGIVLAAINRDILAKAGFIVYLYTPLEQILHRLEKDTTRPLLATPDKTTRIRELLEFRDPLYRATSHATIDTTDTTPEALATQIWRLYTIKNSTGI
jgi:shikimate kinase